MEEVSSPNHEDMLDKKDSFINKIIDISKLKGLVVLCGDSRSGKSTILLEIKNKLDRSIIAAVHEHACNIYNSVVKFAQYNTIKRLLKDSDMICDKFEYLLIDNFHFLDQKIIEDLYYKYSTLKWIITTSCNYQLPISFVIGDEEHVEIPSFVEDYVKEHNNTFELIEFKQVMEIVPKITGDRSSSYDLWHYSIDNNFIKTRDGDWVAVTSDFNTNPDGLKLQQILKLNIWCYVMFIMPNRSDYGRIARVISISQNSLTVKYKGNDLMVTRTVDRNQKSKTKIERHQFPLVTLGSKITIEELECLEIRSPVKLSKDLTEIEIEMAKAHCTNILTHL